MRCLVRVTGIGVASIAMGCPNLVELDLKRCYSVDDASIWAVARYSQNLRQVNHVAIFGFSLSLLTFLLQDPDILFYYFWLCCSLTYPTVKSQAWACAIC